MVTGDIPVTGSAVEKQDQFMIGAKNPQPNDNLKVRTTPGKTLHIFVDTGKPNVKPFDEDLDKGTWHMEITEI